MIPEPGGYGYSDRWTLMLPETSFEPDEFEHVYKTPDIAVLLWSSDCFLLNHLQL